MIKKLFFVSYGGGHIKLLLPVIKKLQKQNYELTILGLTTAISILDSEKIPYKSYKDYTFLFTDDYKKYGEKLIEELTGTLIDRNETICYLG